MRRAFAASAIACALLASAVAPAGPADEAWRDLLVFSGPGAGEEPPHPEALHEWWQGGPSSLVAEPQGPR